MFDLVQKTLTCPTCKRSIIKSHAKNCIAKNKITKVDGIWDFVSSSKEKSQVNNEDKHSKGSWHRIDDGSYEILAAIARGNKAIDIACGDGYIEELAPQTVGVDYSISALKKAKQNGAKYLVCARAENLPFATNSFDIAICAGSIENIENPQKAILEMARVSKMQIMTVHREFSFPLARLVRSLISFFFNIENQAVEKPLKWQELEKYLKKAKLHIVFKGLWTLPVNYGKVVSFLPVFKSIPSCFFVITIKDPKNAQNQI